MKSSSQYSLCVSDLIMGLLFIFILILMKFMLEYKNKKTELLVPLTQRALLLKNIKKDLENKDLQVEIDEKNGVLTLSDISYFSKGSYTLSPKGKEALKKIRKTFSQKLICYSDLNKTLDKWKQRYGENHVELKNWKRWEAHCSKKYKEKDSLIDSILIEGHADPTPIGKGLKQKGIKTNMDLAMKRSQTVLYYLTDYKEATYISKEDGNYLYHLSNEQEHPLFGLSSYGNLRSKERELGSEGKNRRIDIRFIMIQSKDIKEEL